MLYIWIKFRKKILEHNFIKSLTKIKRIKKFTWSCTYSDQHVNNVGQAECDSRSAKSYKHVFTDTRAIYSVKWNANSVPQYRTLSGFLNTAHLTKIMFLPFKIAFIFLCTADHMHDMCTSCIVLKSKYTSHGTFLKLELFH
jgi:hypothetical protein